MPPKTKIQPKSQRPIKNTTPQTRKSLAFTKYRDSPDGAGIRASLDENPQPAHTAKREEHAQCSAPAEPRYNSNSKPMGFKWFRPRRARLELVGSFLLRRLPLQPHCTFIALPAKFKHMRRATNTDLRYIHCARGTF